jgi:tetratricopeptide (TPR) repeat protein
MQQSGPGEPPAAADTERVDGTDPGAAADASTDPATEADRDPLLMLLVRWEEAIARGEDPDPQTLCGDNLLWLPALRERIAKRKRLRSVLAMPAAPESDWVEPPLPDLPGHEVLDRLGRGGMGIVYRARDVRLGRIVALKTLAEARYATREQVERFLDEARAIARLRHPNIVAIHAIGEHRERPYLSLEYLEGGSLADRLAGGPMAPRPAAELVETLARAIDAAHRAGVVHRDLKPGNVLLTADGMPKVADFGLAKLLDSDAARTYSGQVMGTPSYMAPEQAEGRSARVGPAADVYALGAILYQSLTGRPPFLGDSALETIKLVSTTEAVPPTRLRPGVPRDLETICLRCLEKDPARRYDSAAALAAALRRFLDGRPILARPVGAPGRLLRWARRNRTLAAVSAASAVLAVICALGAPAFFALWLAARADQQRADLARGKAVAALAEVERAHRRADEARRRAETARDRAVNAIRGILGTEVGDLMLEETRPYRQLLTSNGLREAQELVRALEDDPQVVYGHLALAGLQLDAGQAQAAAETGRKVLALAEALDTRRHSEESRGLLALTLHRLTGLPGSPEEVRARARRSNTLFEEIAAGRPDRPLADAHSMSLNHYNTGHSWFYEWNLSEAAASFEAAIRVCEEAIRRGDQDRSIQIDLARALVYLGRVRIASGRCDDAVGPARRAIGIYRHLLDQSPSDYSTANLLYLAHEELSFAYQGLNRWADVIACHEAARATLKAAAERNRGVVSRMAGIQAALAMVDFNLALAYGSDPARYYGPYRAAFAEAYNICDKLELVEPLSDDLKTVLAQALYQKADSRAEDGLSPDPGLLERAERVCEELCVKQPGNRSHRAMRVSIRLELADELEVLGRPADARACRELAFAGARGDGAALFEAGAVAAENARLTGTYPTRLDARRLQERRNAFHRRGVALIRRGIDEGFRDAARLRNTPELASLRDDPEFRAVVASLDDRVFPGDPFVPGR